VGEESEFARLIDGVSISTNRKANATRVCRKGISVYIRSVIFFSLVSEMVVASSASGLDGSQSLSNVSRRVPTIETGPTS
jgi:hypothetical protein